MNAAPVVRRARRARRAAWLVLSLVVGLAYVGWPRRVDLRRFAPPTLGQMEAGMWREYYEGRYASLLGTLYALNRSQYGFSPWDSARLSFYAGRAAAVFQPTRSRAEAQAALPHLERYFGLLTRRTKLSLPAGDLARLELEWWQQRREGVAATNYAAVIAQVEAALYGVAESLTRPSALIRAEAMALRDARGRDGMRMADWLVIEQQLTRSYRLLHAAVNPGNDGVR